MRLVCRPHGRGEHQRVCLPQIPCRSPLPSPPLPLTQQRVHGDPRQLSVRSDRFVLVSPRARTDRHTGIVPAAMARHLTVFRAERSRLNGTVETITPHVA